MGGNVAIYEVFSQYDQIQLSVPINLASNNFVNITLLQSEVIIKDLNMKSDIASKLEFTAP